MSNQMQETINTLREALGMVEDLDLFNSEIKWRSNYLVEMGQLQKCFGRTIKAVNTELLADWRDSVDHEIETVVDVVETTNSSNKPLEVATPTSTETIAEIIAPTKEWDVEVYNEYFEEYKHLTCENYVMLLNELIDSGDGSDEHITAVDDLIEEAWSLNCGQSLNDNLTVIEDRLKALKAGEVTTALPVVETSVASEDDVSCEDDIIETTEETDMSIFNGYNWWSDEDHNGKPEDIFKFALQIDPNTCTIEEFLHGLLYARVERDTGKEGSLKAAELVDLCSQRAFPGVAWPVNGKGITVATKARKLIKPTIDDLKSKTDYTKAGLKELTKHGYPTHAFYTQDHLDQCINDFCSPADDIEGDDLDEMFDSIDPSSIQINAGVQVEEDEDEDVDQEPKELKQELITNAAQRALDFLNR